MIVEILSHRAGSGDERGAGREHDDLEGREGSVVRGVGPDEDDRALDDVGRGAGRGLADDGGVGERDVPVPAELLVVTVPGEAAVTLWPLKSVTEGSTMISWALKFEPVVRWASSGRLHPG